MAGITVTVKGDQALRRKLSRAKYSPQISRFLRSSGRTVQGRALDAVPRWDGNLANSIIVELDTATPPRYVRIGTNAEYAEPVEKGSRPHWPPLDAITPWANDHGMEPAVLQAAIGRHGTKPHPFLKPALEDSTGEINGFLRILAADIEAAS